MRELCRFDVHGSIHTQVLFRGQLAGEWRKSPFGCGQSRRSRLTGAWLDGEFCNREITVPAGDFRTEMDGCVRRCERARDGGADRHGFGVEHMHAHDPVRSRSEDDLPALRRLRDRHDVGRQIEIASGRSRTMRSTRCVSGVAGRARLRRGRDGARMAAVRAGDVEDRRRDRLADDSGVAAAALHTHPVVGLINSFRTVRSITTFSKFRANVGQAT